MDSKLTADAKLFGHGLVEAAVLAAGMGMAKESQQTNELVAVGSSTGMERAEFRYLLLLPSP